jgi:magnesium and cobalt transporter
MLHLKDYVRWKLDHPTDPELRHLCRRAITVQARMPLEELLVLFRRERGRVALVLDADGSTAGLVALHDLAEQIVGALPD